MFTHSLFLKIKKIFITISFLKIVLRNMYNECLIIVGLTWLDTFKYYI
jgi:hypothetical protein